MVGRCLMRIANHLADIKDERRLTVSARAGVVKIVAVDHHADLPRRETPRLVFPVKYRVIDVRPKLLQNVKHTI